MVACSVAEWGMEMVEIEAWFLSHPKYLSPCAIPTPKEAWAICLMASAGPGVSDSKEPRCWASEHLQTLDHEQRILIGYSPWGHKESDTTELISNLVD